MSRMRPECGTAKGPSLFSYETAFFRVMQAVARRRVLIHGRLEDGRGHYCAIGCTFEDGAAQLPSNVVDEVAAYNDSFPKLNAHERRNKVLAWLRFRVKAMGQPG